MALRHGTRTKYNAGCRCAECKQAASDYERARRQAINAQKHAPAKLTALPGRATTGNATPPATVEAGRVESGVMAEIGELSTAASRQGLVEIAIALARVLDSPLAIAQHPSAAHRLSETLDKIRKGADARKSKLASVRQMTSRSTEATA
jgi:hypothetical protein